MLAVKGLQRDHCAERGCGHGDAELNVQIVALPLEDRMRLLDDLDVDITGGAVAGTHLALAGQQQPGAGLHTGRDLDLDGLPGAHPAVTGALRTR